MCMLVPKCAKFPYLVMDMPVCVLGSVRVLAHALTGTGICMYGCVIIRILFCFSYHLCIYLLEVDLVNVPVPVWVQYITGTGIPFNANTGNVPCQYWYILVQYQYRHGTLLVLALNCACTDNGIFALLSSTSMGTVHYRYWH
jgi:hypothetical protein